MKDSYLITLRNKEIKEVYKIALSIASPPFTKQKIVKEIVMCRSSRFWVSAERASRVMYRLVKGDTSSIDKLPSYKKRMYEEIYNRMLELNKNGDNRSIYRKVNDIIYQPAPEFYVDYRNVMVWIV